MKMTMKINMKEMEGEAQKQKTRKTKMDKK